jgi:hypothetical protein
MPRKKPRTVLWSPNSLLPRTFSPRSIGVARDFRILFPRMGDIFEISPGEAKYSATMIVFTTCSILHHYCSRILSSSGSTCLSYQIMDPCCNNYSHKQADNNLGSGMPDKLPQALHLQLLFQLQVKYDLIDDTRLLA